MSVYQKALDILSIWRRGETAPELDEETRKQIDALMDEYQSEIEENQAALDHACDLLRAADQ